VTTSSEPPESTEASRIAAAGRGGGGGGGGGRGATKDGAALGIRRGGGRGGDVRTSETRTVGVASAMAVPRDGARGGVSAQAAPIASCTAEANSAAKNIPNTFALHRLPRPPLPSPLVLYLKGLTQLDRAAHLPRVEATSSCCNGFCSVLRLHSAACGSFLSTSLSAAGNV
jgi:hypothetical protein